MIIDYLAQVAHPTTMAFFRLKSMYRSQKKLAQWVRRWVKSRDLLVEKVLKKWCVSEQRSRSISISEDPEYISCFVVLQTSHRQGGKKVI